MKVTLNFDDATVQRLHQQFPNVELSDVASRCLERMASDSSNVGALQAEDRLVSKLMSALREVEGQLPAKAPAGPPVERDGRGGASG